MFISTAFAQTPGSFFGGGDMLTSLLPFALIFVIMYFLILRPQQKRVKAHQELVKNVRRGDTVITNGGLIGRVAKVVDDVEIEIEYVSIKAKTGEKVDAVGEGRAIKTEAIVLLKQN